MDLIVQTVQNSIGGNAVTLVSPPGVPFQSVTIQGLPQAELATYVPGEVVYVTLTKPPQPVV
jgi:hypothetical protein